MRGMGGKLLICAGVVVLFVATPLFSGWPASAPAVFRQSLGGVPVSIWFGMVMLAAWPVIAWLNAGRAGPDDEA